MNRRGPIPPGQEADVPRRRGDEPGGKHEENDGAFMFPAGAGMNRFLLFNLFP